MLAKEYLSLFSIKNVENLPQWLLLQKEQFANVLTVPQSFCHPPFSTYFLLSVIVSRLPRPFFCIPVFPSLFVCKIHLSVCPIVYLHPHVLLYVLLSFFKLFVNPHFRPSDWSSLCHCVISSLFSQSPFLSINSG